MSIWTPCLWWGLCERAFLSCSSSYRTPSSLLFCNVSLKSGKKWKRKKEKMEQYIIQKDIKVLGPHFAFLSAFSRLSAVLSLWEVLSPQNNPVLQITTVSLPWSSFSAKNFQMWTCFSAQTADQQWQLHFFFFFYDLGNSDIGHKSYITTSQVFSTYSPQSVSLPHIPPFESIS